jgi:flagellar biosynthesis/type III secretory pathway M-ring protein FliF/YscJ
MSLILQVALPPSTPTPLPPVSAELSFQTQQSILIGLAIVAVSVVAIIVLRPILAALARRFEGKSLGAEVKAELDQLRDHMAEVEPLRNRVLELEERLEFAERLLAQRKDQDLLPRGGSS